LTLQTDRLTYLHWKTLAIPNSSVKGISAEAVASYKRHIDSWT